MYVACHVSQCGYQSVERNEKKMEGNPGLQKSSVRVNVHYLVLVSYSSSDHIGSQFRNICASVALGADKNDRNYEE